MSLHECVVFVLCYVTLISILWKWSKLVLLIILMEFVSALTMAGLISAGLISALVLYIFLFFVCEALIILSSLFNQMRMLSPMYSVVGLF